MRPARAPRPRSVIVVTGSEVVRGDIHDENGPYLAAELGRLGLEPARILVVGDDPAELAAALTDGLRADLCVVSGGLGPTHDDRTIELIARAAGRELVLDPDLEAEIERVSRAFAARARRPYADFAHGVKKQALLPQGAISLGLAGTAPGVVLAQDATSGERARVVVALPGPPGELRRLWPRALQTEPVRAILEAVRAPERRVLRFFGVGESSVAQVLEEAGGEGDGVEATICARDFEIHVDLVVSDDGDERAARLERALRDRLAAYLFSDDERRVEEHVLALCRSRGLTLGTAESCTGGLVAARLTSVPGSSDVFRGAIVAYADDVKREELAVPAGVLERRGAVSAETAAAMAEGARARLRTDVAIAVTGIAGPGGGTPEKPVGLVYAHVAGPAGSRSADFNVRADRETIRRRAAVVALHLARSLLAGEPGRAEAVSAQSRDERG